MFRHGTVTSVTILGLLTMNVTQAEGQRPLSQPQERDLQSSNAFRECEDRLAKRTGKPYRLLSEAEWEFAARAGTEARYPFEDRASGICQHANGGDQDFTRATSIQSDIACNDGHAYPAPGGTFPVNGFGLHDMQGNVAEWVEESVWLVR